MEILSLLLGIVALLIGVFHVIEINRVWKRTEAQSANLDSIRGAISTHYLAEFPNFIPDIVHLIEHAHTKVQIFCDIPAYGQFTDRSDWLKYSHAIEDLKKNVKVSLTCLNNERRVAFYHEQFLQEQSWDQWKSLNTEKLEDLLLVNKSTMRVDSLTEEEFVRFLEDTNKVMIRGAFARAELREIEFFMPIYFWLVDGTQAIFSVPAFSGGHTEYGFITNDQQLISALVNMRERYERRQPAHGHVASIALSNPAPKMQDQ